MSEEPFFLIRSTRAISGAENAIHLIEQKERVEQAVVLRDAPLTLDTAKAFLETIFKTILKDRMVGADLNLDLSPLYKLVKSALVLNRDSIANEFLGSLISGIVHKVGELRNKFGAASHGNDGLFQNPIEMPEAEMVANVIDGIAAFLFVKHKSSSDPSNAVRIHYNDYPEFNDFWDNQRESYKFELADGREIEFLPSKLLFMADPDAFAYREMLLQYRSTEVDDSDETIEVNVINEVRVVDVAVVGDSLHSDEEMHSQALAGIDTAQFEIEAMETIQNLIRRDEIQNPEEESLLREGAVLVIEEVQNSMVVDWHNRPSAIARLRNKIRFRLRSLEYSVSDVNRVAESIIVWYIDRAANL